MAQAVGGRYGFAARRDERALPAAGDALQRRRACPRAMTAVPVERVEELARLAGFERLRDLGVPEEDLDELGAVAAGRARREGESAPGDRHRGGRVAPVSL